MTALNANAANVLAKMVSLAVENGGYTRIETNGTFMGVSVEVLHENAKYRCISVAHYSESCGDLMADPEMCFLEYRTAKEFYPISFKNDWMGYDRQSVILEWLQPVQIIHDMQHDQAKFADTWMRNIKEQQAL
jgi:hypothetical protein